MFFIDLMYNYLLLRVYMGFDIQFDIMNIEIKFIIHSTTFKFHKKCNKNLGTITQLYIGVVNGI